MRGTMAQMLKPAAVTLPEMVVSTSREQELASTRDLQLLRIDKVVTTTVTLRLLEVSDPGRGRSARNYTAISDVSLVGKPA